jgi:hypothetical protein
VGCAPRLVVEFRKQQDIVHQQGAELVGDLGDR